LLTDFSTIPNLGDTVENSTGQKFKVVSRLIETVADDAVKINLTCRQVMH